MYRTDKHNNPAAFITAIAKEAGLVEGRDYERGDPFTAGGRILYTAKLLKDPIETTIRVIDTLGFFTHSGVQRWVYIAIPTEIWRSLTHQEKSWVIGWMYKHEGGIEMQPLFSGIPSPV